MTYKQNINQEVEIDGFWRSYYADRKESLQSSTYKKISFLAFLIFFVFISFDSSAEQCGVAGSSWQSNGSTIQTYTFTNDIPCNAFVILTGVEYAVLKEQSTTSSTSGLQELLVTLFYFDAEVFAIVELALIMAFLTSHYAGRVVRWLGK